MNRRRPISPCSAALLVALLGDGLPLIAQEAPQATYVERVDVRVLNVDVHATDRAGNPIPGLTQEAFQLFENDKQKVKPTYFAEIKGADEPLTLILYIDEYNLRALNRDRALATLAPELRRVLEASPVPAMVVRYDGSFAIVQGRTAESAPILSALEALSGTESVGDRAEAAERGAQNSVREILRQTRAGSSGDRVAAMASIDCVFAEMRGYGQRELEDVQRSTQGLLSFVRSMAFVPGPKAVVYLSDGLAMQPLDSLLRTVQNLMTGGAGRGEELMSSQGGQAGTGTGTTMTGGIMSRDVGMELGRLQQDVEPFSARSLFDSLVAEANTYRITFYPIKAQPAAAASADSRTAGGGSPELSNLREALEFLAEATGGKAHTTDTAPDGFLPELLRDYEHYYSLGIDVAAKPAGSVTALLVKMKEKGVQVRYRQSYQAKDFWDRLLDGTLASLLHGVGSNQAEIEVAIESQTAAEDGTVAVKMAVDFPIGKIGLAEDSGVHSADAKLAIAVLDAQSRLVAAHRLEIPLQIPAAAHADAVGQYYRALVELRLPPGEQRLGVGLWDGVAGQVSYLAQALTIGAP